MKPLLDSMDWVRGEMLGCGSFSTVSLAIPKETSAPLMAVKSCDLLDSVQLKNEQQVLSQLGKNKYIIHCFGGHQSVEKGQNLYNLLLEYASGGSLIHRVKKSCGGCLPESEAKRYTKSVLQGLRYIHAKGFTHCDIKLQNLLLFDNGDVKIADFGLAKKAGEKQGKVEIRGTPLYMSPESVSENEYDSPCDIWALGCALVEMVSGKPAWNCNNVAALLIKIGVGDELPEIPQELSKEGKDFLAKCFIKDPKLRWTADMLLGHPFLANYDDDHNTVTLNRGEAPSSSPRCHFEFAEWESIPSPTPRSELWSTREGGSRFDWSSLSSFPPSSPVERVQQLSSDVACDWSLSEGWISVR